MKIFITIFLTLSIFSSTGCSDSQLLTASVKDSEPSAAARITPAPVGSAEANMIEAGRRVGPLHLGSDFDAAVSILGKPIFDQSYGSSVCSAREVRWLVSLKNDQNALLLATFSSEGEIVRLQTEMNGFATPGGVRNGDSLKVFRSKYDERTLTAYADRGLKSNSKHVEGYSAYILDSDRGVAYEFRKSRTDRTWYLEATSVFEAMKDFATFRYCVASDKEKWWIRLNSLDLDSAAELAD